ncbi:MAG: hypothetical protein ABII97_02415, partial [Patescibacteria group bacterium]
METENSPDIQSIQTKKTDLISLKEASSLFGYTQHHLGLLCRQGKVKAERIGRRWFTTKVWIEEHIAGVEDHYKNQNKDYVSKKTEAVVKEIEEEIKEVSQEKILPKLDFNFDKVLVPAGVAFASLLLIFSVVRADVLLLKSTLEEIKTAYKSLPETFSRFDLNEIKTIGRLADLFEKTDDNFDSLVSTVVKSVDGISIPTLASVVSPITSAVHYEAEKIEEFGNKTKRNVVDFGDDVKSFFTRTKKFAENSFGNFLNKFAKESITEVEPPEEVQPPQVESSSDTEKELAKLKLELSGLIDSRSVTVQSAVVERTIEKIIAGITQGDLDNLNESILSHVEEIRMQLLSEINLKVGGAHNAITLTQKIDNLSSPTISSPTVSGTSEMTIVNTSGRATLESLTVTNNAQMSSNLSVGGLATFANATSTLFTTVSNTWLATDGSNVGIGTTSPSAVLSVAGTIYSGAGGFQLPDGTIIDDSGDLGKWTTSGTSIYYNTGNVGVGTTSPDVLFVVGSSTPNNIATANYYNSAYIAGDLEVDGTIYGSTSFTNSSTTQLTVSDYLWIGDEDADNLDIRAGIWNLTSIATTTVAMSNGLNFDSNTFVIDPVSDRIGVGTSTPSVALSIDSTDAVVLPAGTTAQRPGVGLNGMIRYNTENSTFEGYGASNWSGLGGVIDVDQDTYILAESSSGADEDVLFFYTNNVERARLDSSGNFGIGTTS